METNALYDAKDESYYANSRSELLTFVPADASTLLDVGCGAGRFGELAKGDSRLETWGIEMNEGAALQAERRLDHVLTSPLEESLASLPEHHFDCITFNDVLEHMADPVASLKMMQPYLTKNGVVIASIPNMRYWRILVQLVRDKDFEYQTHGIMDETHRWFFTEKSMHRMFVSADYGVLSSTGIHATGSRWFKVANFLSFGALADMAYHQFVIVARPRPANSPA